MLYENNQSDRWIFPASCGKINLIKMGQKAAAAQKRRRAPVSGREITMEELSNKEIQKRRMLSYFIEATQQVIEEEGVLGVSIRKVAKKAGYNSATIYNYFKDIDQLVLLASMKYLRSYTIALNAQIKEDRDPRQNYLDVWKFFAQSALEHPNTFNNLFFSRHSNRLNDVVQLYYSVFPDEVGTHASIIDEMFSGPDIWERNQRLLLPLVRAGVLTEEQSDIVNDISVSCFHSILERKCQDESLDNQPLIDRLMRILEYALG